MKYGCFGNAPGNTTAANAGIISINNAGSAPISAPRIYEWEIGPAANSADNTYTVRVKRNTTAGTFTSITPSSVDNKTSVSLTVSGNQSTVVGGADVELMRAGFHMRGGYRWVAIPGGELAVFGAVSKGIFIEYIFADLNSLSTCSGSLKMAEPFGVL